MIRSLNLTLFVKKKMILIFNLVCRSFHLRLKRDASTFMKDPEIEYSDGSIGSLDTSHIYEGDLIGE
jgi:hypothetical protein